MGYKPFEFINAYYENIDRQNIEAIESHPLGLVICRLLDEVESVGQTEWFGPTGACLEELNEVAQKYKINVDSKLWPKSTNSLSHEEMALMMFIN